MILIDANLLLYAYNRSAAQHERARRWLELTLSGRDPVRLAWATVLAFLRIGTHPQAFERPLGVEEARDVVGEWFRTPAVAILDPGERHWQILGELLVGVGARGPLVSDAHLAALAIEHGAVLQTTDRDFARFAGLRFVNPLTAE